MPGLVPLRFAGGHVAGHVGVPSRFQLVVELHLPNRTLLSTHYLHPNSPVPMAVREIENFDFLRGRRVAASGCSLEPRTSFSSASDAGCKTKPLQHSFSGQVSLRLQRFSLHWVSVVQQSRLLDFFSRAQLCSFSFSSSHPQQVNHRGRPDPF